MVNAMLSCPCAGRTNGRRFRVSDWARCRDLPDLVDLPVGAGELPSSGEQPERLGERGVLFIGEQMGAKRLAFK